jgi:hypothetical protein
MGLDWLAAIALGSAALLGGILVWLGKRDPSTAPYNPGVGRMPGGLYQLRRELREKEAREADGDKGKPS